MLLSSSCWESCESNNDVVPKPADLDNLQIESKQNMEKLIKKIDEINEKLNNQRVEITKISENYNNELHSLLKNLQEENSKQSSTINNNLRKQIDAINRLYIDLNQSITDLKEAFWIILGGMDESFKSVNNRINGINKNNSILQDIKKKLDCIPAIQDILNKIDQEALKIPEVVPGLEPIRSEIEILKAELNAIREALKKIESVYSEVKKIDEVDSKITGLITKVDKIKGPYIEILDRAIDEIKQSINSLHGVVDETLKKLFSMFEDLEFKLNNTRIFLDELSDSVNGQIKPQLDQIIKMLNEGQKKEVPVKQSGTEGGGNNANGEGFADSGISKKVNDKLDKLDELENRLKDYQQENKVMFSKIDDNFIKNQSEIKSIRNKLDAEQIKKKLFKLIEKKKNEEKNKLDKQLLNDLIKDNLLMNIIKIAFHKQLKKKLPIKDENKLDDLVDIFAIKLKNVRENELKILLGNVLNTVLDFSNELPLVMEEQSNIDIYNYCISTATNDNELVHNLSDALYHQNIKLKHIQDFNNKLDQLLQQADTKDSIINTLTERINDVYTNKKNDWYNDSNKKSKTIFYLFVDFILSKDRRNQDDLFADLASHTVNELILMLSKAEEKIRNIISNYAQHQIELQEKSKIAYSLVNIITKKLVEEKKELTAASNRLEFIISRVVFLQNKPGLSF